MPAPIIFVLTGSPAAGIDPRGLIDTRPLTRELYHYILNHRELYGLPRKFNIAFDGGGSLGVLEDTTPTTSVLPPLRLGRTSQCRRASISGAARRHYGPWRLRA